MGSNFNAGALQQYETVFGSDKMKQLFGEFRQKADEDLTSVPVLLKEDAREKLRLIYHSLRSSSLVFGMEGFSALCREIEESLLSGAALKEFTALSETAARIYGQEITQVENYLK